MDEAGSRDYRLGHRGNLVIRLWGHMSREVWLRGDLSVTVVLLAKCFVLLRVHTFRVPWIKEFSVLISKFLSILFLLSLILLLLWLFLLLLLSPLVFSIQGYGQRSLSEAQISYYLSSWSCCCIRITFVRWGTRHNAAWGTCITREILQSKCNMQLWPGRFVCTQCE